MRTYLGKIESIKLGLGGYDGAMFGFTVVLRSKSNGSWVDFAGTWKNDPMEGASWTKEDQRNMFGDVMLSMLEHMEKAKVSDLYGLNNAPVKIICDDSGKLMIWRILEEVI